MKKIPHISLLSFFRFCHWWGHAIFFSSGMLWLIGCQQPLQPYVELPPISVPETVVFDDGTEVVITRILTPTPVPPTPQPTIFVPPSLVQLDLGMNNGIDLLDPQQANDKNTLNFIESLYVGLTNFNHFERLVQPELAQSWEISPDGTVWLFHLRDDIFWVKPKKASGEGFGNNNEETPLRDVEAARAVVAQDVVFALQQACSPTTFAPDVVVLFIIVGCQEVHGLKTATEADLATIGVSAKGDHTVEIRLREPSQAFLVITTMPLFRPIPYDRIESDDDQNWLTQELFLSSGPFFINQWEDPSADQPLTILQRNPLWPADISPQDSFYPEGKVQLINIYRYETELIAFNQWSAGLLDIAKLPATFNSGYVDAPVPPPLVTSQEMFYIGFNFDSPAFNNAAVRRAFSASIDREKVIKEVYNSRAAPMRHLTPPGALHAPAINEVGIGFNPDFARLQMVSSGAGSCQLLGKIRYMIGTSDTELQLAELLIEMWVETLSCKKEQFEIQQIQFGALLANTRAQAGKARPDLFNLGWSSFYPDAHDWFSNIIHCSWRENRQNRPCSEVDTLIEQAYMAPQDQRDKLYRKLENMLFSEDGIYPIVPLYVRGEYRLIQDWVSFAVPSNFGGEQWDTYRVNQELKDIERNQ